MLDEPDVAVVIVNYRTPDHVLACLRALQDERSRWSSFDVVVVDGGSGDGSAVAIADATVAQGMDGWAKLLPLSVNGGFGYANNEAIRRLLSRPKAPSFIHFLNPDTVPQPGAVRLLLEAMLRDRRAGCAGSLLVTADGRAQGSAFDFHGIRSEFARGSGLGIVQRLLGCRACVEASHVTEVDWVTGASLMVRAEALRQVGLFDEGFFLYFEELELIQRMRRHGWNTLHVPASRVAHIGGVSTGVADGASATRRLPHYWFQSRKRYFALTRGRLAASIISLSWLTGSAIWQLRSMIPCGRRWSGRAPHEARDLIKHGIWPDRQDAEPQIPAWNSPIDRQPYWMSRTGVGQ